jgi:hypothetical protein
MPKPKETPAEQKAREQREAEAAEREELERETYSEYGLDYDDEDTRRAVAVRRLARRLDNEETERKKPPKKESLFGL